MWCSSLNRNFRARYDKFKYRSMLFTKTAQELDILRRERPKYFYNNVLYRKLFDEQRPGEWITPFYLIVQYAPLPVVDYVVNCRQDDRAIASDKPTALHAACCVPTKSPIAPFNVDRINLLANDDFYGEDAFGRPCFFYVQNVRLLCHLISLGVVLDRRCAQFAVQTDNPMLLFAAHFAFGIDEIAFLPEAVESFKPNVVNHLINDLKMVDRNELHHRAYIALAIHHRFDRHLFAHFWNLATLTGDSLPPLTGVDEYIDQFYCRQHGPGSPQRIDYHLNMITEYSRPDDVRAEHLNRYVDLILRYPENFTFSAHFPIFEVMRAARSMPLSVTERFVVAFPLFTCPDAYMFLFFWMENLKGNPTEAYAALLSRVVAFREPVTRGTFLHQLPNLEFLRLCLDAGAEVDALDRRGNTPLVLYARDEAWDCVRELLSRGAHQDVRKVNREKMKRFLEDAATIDVFPLKCLTARVVSKFGRLEKRQLPKSLKNFVKVH